MAKAPKKVKVKETDIVKIASEKDLEKALGCIDDMNEDATYLSESPLSEVSDWISTGCYALNAIMSGSVYHAVPVGRITTFYGLQSTGKTLILNKIIANAMANNGFKRAVYFDTETALDLAVAERLGCDPKRLKHVPVETIEDCKIQIITLLTRLIEAHAKGQVILAIDSLGNMNSAKEFTDVEKESQSGDMGLRAKALTSLMRMMTYRAAKAGCPVLCTNHIYENPGQLHPTMIKKQAGGLKPLYIASLLVQLSVTNQKTSDNKKAATSAMSDRVNGVNLKAITAKNRFIPPFIGVDDLEINFKTGLNKYKGLLDLATRYDLIDRTGSTYVMDGNKIGYAASFESSAEFWENGPLQKLDKLLQADLNYSNEKFTDLKAEVEAEVEAEENELEDVDIP
jgi:recombination protein RecA|tara:strand:+ start:2532 stop:3725 length:1194 start_codon:yes stop_codon:yes gene_type:complete